MFRWIDGLGPCPWILVGMRVSKFITITGARESTLMDIWLCRIVEYATRDQAQAAVAQLSNQTLMGRLVYVREVSFRIIV